MHNTRKEAHLTSGPGILSKASIYSRLLLKSLLPVWFEQQRIPPLPPLAPSDETENKSQSGSLGGRAIAQEFEAANLRGSSLGLEKLGGRFKSEGDVNLALVQTWK